MLLVLKTKLPNVCYFNNFSIVKMLFKIKASLSRHITNIPGWRTDRKIVVIESDDWGAIRTPSKESLFELRKYGLPIEVCHYMMNDTLATAEDLEALFNVLESIKNGRGEHPVITANTIVANPDFEKIKKYNFREYHYELFTETLMDYPDHSNSFDLWKQGMREKLFHPQFHGREHLHVQRWLKDLQNGSEETLLAFDNRFYGISSTVSKMSRKSYQAAYDSENEYELNFVRHAVEHGLKLFERLFGYKSLSSIAPNYIWSNDVEKVLKRNGIKYLQGGRVQRLPVLDQVKDGEYIRRHTGDENDIKQLYLVRNCIFEPSSDRNSDWVEQCLRDIKTAFFWKKPAIIDSHRVNYIGSINPENRDRSLRDLLELLNKIVTHWPEVEFMSSDQLGTVIENDGK